MATREIAAWLEATALSQAIQNAVWLVALTQIIHIAAVGIVLSSVAVVGLRGARAGEQPPAAPLIVWIWLALLALFVTGLAQIIAEPGRTLVDNPAFNIKMALLAAAIGALLAYQAAMRRGRPRRGSGSKRAFAIAAFALVCAIAVAGRWIAYSQAT